MPQVERHSGERCSKSHKVVEARVAELGAQVERAGLTEVTAAVAMEVVESVAVVLEEQTVVVDSVAREPRWVCTLILGSRISVSL